MLTSTALGVPRFSMTRDLRSSSTRRRSFPKFARACRAETIIVPFFLVVVVVDINSPFQLFELYSLTVSQSTKLIEVACPRLYKIPEALLSCPWAFDLRPFPYRPN